MSSLEDLYNYINRNNISNIKNILNRSTEFDLTIDNCDLFTIPISKNRPDIINILLKYFFNTQLYNHQVQSPEYKVLLSKMNYNLSEYFEDDDEIPYELQEVFDKYKQFGLVVKAVGESSEEYKSSLGSIDSNYKTEYSPKEILSVSDELPNNFTIRDKKLIHDNNVSTTASENIGLFFNTPKIDTYNDDFSIDYSTYLSQQITDTCLGNSDTSTQDSSAEKELSGESNDNTNITEFG